MHLDQLMHAADEVVRGFAFGHVHVSPGLMRIEEYQQVRGAVTPIFMVDARWLARLRWPWNSSLVDELDRSFIGAHHRTARVGDLAKQVEHIFHPRDVLGINAGNAPHLVLPWLDRLLGQSPTPRQRVRTHRRDQQRLLASITTTV